MDLSEVAFVDLEADRGGRLVAVGAVRGDERLRLGRAELGTAREALGRFIGERPVGGHNLMRFDRPLLEGELGLALGERPMIDTMWLSMLAWPGRASHALDKGGEETALPDPVADALASRTVAARARDELSRLEPAVAGLYAALLARSDRGGLALALAGASSRGADDVVDACRQLPEDYLERFCRVHLDQLVGELIPDDRVTALALALALRFIEVQSHTRDERWPEAQLHGPPSAALAAVPRFGELLTRLMGPLCPDLACAFRQRCQVHRPLAEEILQRNFDLPSFRPGQKEIVTAVLGDRRPLVILPTGGGKSLCYQVPAVHGGERLHGLTVIISPLQALMADQVNALFARYPATCFINSSLLMGERSEHLKGLRSGKYNVLYIGPEQLRNPSMLGLLRGRPPFLWVVDEAHCISQWGHNFRTDYTHLPRAIASIHPHGRRPLIALFTATATKDVRADIAAQVRSALGLDVTLMDFGSRRDNLHYEVVRCRDGQQKMNELIGQLRACPEGARLVYCATTRQVEDTVALLREQDIDCAMYHGQLPASDKREQLERFLGGASDTVVATSAFGMGIDKPDIRLVVHYAIPGSIEDYVQETGRAGRDGAPSRCVLLFQEEDLDVQFFLKTATRITKRDVRFVFHALRARARRFRRHGRDGWVDLWVSAEDLFVEESLADELDWSSDTLHHKLKLVLYHLEMDGVVQRLENRTRTVGIFPRCASLPEAEGLLREKTAPASVSPVAERVLRYLYDPERPHRVSVLDIADACGVAPRRAFDQVQSLTTLGLVGQDLAFEVTLALGVARSSKELAHERLRIAEALFSIGTDLDEAPILRVRSAAAEIGRVVGARVAPHQLTSLLRALRRLGLVHLDKLGGDVYRLRFDPSAIEARDRLRGARRVSGALFEHLEQQLGKTRGRDVVAMLDINAFVERPTLTEKLDHEEVVSTCLLLHHLDAWHLADPPVLFDMAMRVRVDPEATMGRLDSERPARHHKHQIRLVHMVREYAILPAGQRQGYVEDYFFMGSDQLAEKYFHKRKRAISRPVSAATEAAIVQDLTDAQRDAVTADDGALLVVAGPGSGKTHTVVRRISHMVRARQIRAEHILVLAFNRAAAAELRARLHKALGDRAAWVDVRTFHSLAVKLTGAELFDRADADPDARLDEAMAEATALLATEEEDRPRAMHLRQQVLGGVRHVLVDEYQDLDASQYALLAALVGLDKKRRGLDRTERSVYVVGDDDQAIYGFRNASVEFLRRFEEEFAARRICLRDNFRSNRRIVAAAQGFIERLPGRLKTAPDEQMQPASGSLAGGERAVRRLLFASPEEMAAHAAYAVSRLLEEEEGTIAILGRYWSSLDAVRFLLEEAGVAVTIHHRDFKRPVHRRHPVAFLLDGLWRKRVPLSTSASELLAEKLEGMRRSLDEPICRELLAIAADIDAERESAGRIPYFGRARDLARPSESDSPYGSERGQLQLIAAEATSLPRRAVEPLLSPMTTAELADAIVMGSRDAATRDRASASGAARVHLSTYHGAKGLEFDRVIVLPAPRSTGGDEAEERRTFYVAMTRAKQELTLATLGAAHERAAMVDAPTVDLRGVRRKLGTAYAAYLDCDPSDVRLSGLELSRAQQVIGRLREGEPLDIDRRDDEVLLLARGCRVGALSRAGRARFEKICARSGAEPAARVHEIYQHYERDDDGRITRRWLVVLPTFRAARRGS